jgi:hypothetical protein
MDIESHHQDRGDRDNNDVNQFVFPRRPAVPDRSGEGHAQEAVLNAGGTRENHPGDGILGKGLRMALSALKQRQSSVKAALKWGQSA